MGLTAGLISAVRLAWMRVALCASAVSAKLAQA